MPETDGTAAAKWEDRTHEAVGQLLDARRQIERMTLQLWQALGGDEAGYDVHVGYQEERDATWRTLLTAVERLSPPADPDPQAVVAWRKRIRQHLADIELAAMMDEDPLPHDLDDVLDDVTLDHLAARLMTEGLLRSQPPSGPFAEPPEVVRQEPAELHRTTSAADGDPGPFLSPFRELIHNIQQFGKHWQWRCGVAYSRMDPGWQDGACRYDHTVNSWGQLVNDATEHLSKWHKITVAASPATEGPTPPHEHVWRPCARCPQPDQPCACVGGPCCSAEVAESVAEQAAVPAHPGDPR